MLIPYPNYTDEEMKVQRGKRLSQVTKSRKFQLQIVLSLDTTLSQAVVIDIVPIIPASSTLASVCIFLKMKTHKSKFPIKSLLTNVLTNQKSKECRFPRRSTVCRLDPSTSNPSSSKQGCLWMEVGSIFRPIYTMKKHNQHYTLFCLEGKKRKLLFSSNKLYFKKKHHCF